MLLNIEYSKNTSTKRPERAALSDLISWRLCAIAESAV